MSNTKRPARRAGVVSVPPDFLEGMLASRLGPFAPAPEGEVRIPPPPGPPIIVAAGPAVSRMVTAAQGALIIRQNRLRAALWGIQGARDIAANFSTASARAWRDHGFAGLAGEARALAISLENFPEAADVYYEARSLAFELATEAGEIEERAARR